MQCNLLKMIQHILKYMTYILKASDFTTSHKLTHSLNSILFNFCLTKSKNKYDLHFDTAKFMNQSMLNNKTILLTELFFNLDIANTSVQIEFNSQSFTSIKTFVYNSPIAFCFLSTEPITCGLIIPNNGRTTKFTINQISATVLTHDMITTYNNNIIELNKTNDSLLLYKVNAINLSAKNLHSYFLDYSLYTIFHDRDIYSQIIYDSNFINDDTIIDTENITDNASLDDALKTKLNLIKIKNSNSELVNLSDEKLGFLKQLQSKLLSELELVNNLITQFESTQNSNSPELNLTQDQLYKQICCILHKIILNNNNE